MLLKNCPKNGFPSCDFLVQMVASNNLSLRVFFSQNPLQEIHLKILLPQRKTLLKNL